MRYSNERVDGQERGRGRSRPTRPNVSSSTPGFKRMSMTRRYLCHRSFAISEPVRQSLLVAPNRSLELTPSP